jgi:hypothetical protein
VTTFVAAIIGGALVYGIVRAIYRYAVRVVLTVRSLRDD